MTPPPSTGGPAKLDFPSELPITPRIGEVIERLRCHRVLIVAGETGSGKTTQLPKACLAAGLGCRGLIAHTQPRRLAARTVAARIAAELDVELGGEVGYAVRFDERTSANTVVKVMTDGLLLNEIQRDRRLQRYECVIVDEAHERSLNVDFLLGYLRRLLDEREDLKVVVTSATIDVDAFAKHFGDAPLIEVSGRGYPVETIYRPVEDPERGLVDCLREIAAGASPAPAPVRDVLVFQSGEREIFETSRLLRRVFQDRFEIMPLYARLPEREQRRVFERGRRQRIVLATNVAETSITVPNIGFVVDPGFARISRYSYRAKLQQLPIEPISQASARQRAGRCGRIAPGVCYRLFGEDDFKSQPAYTDPEITRTNLGAVVLTMRAFGFGAIEFFPFIDPPNPRAVRDAVGLLHELRALEGDRLTDAGRTMARLPVDPRLARMLIEASRLGSLAEVLVIVSALAAQDPRLRPLDRREAADKAHAAFADRTSDFLAYVKLWRWIEATRRASGRAAFQRRLQERFLSPARVREWRALHRQLVLACRSLGMRANAKPAQYAAVHRALLAGSLGFIGRKIEPTGRSDRTATRRGRRRGSEYDGARGLRFTLFPGSAVSVSPPKWVVAAEISVTGRAFARCVAKVAPAWIEQAAPHLLKRSYSEPRWDSRRGEAMVGEQVSVYGLVVAAQHPRRAVAIDPDAAREIFVHAALVGCDRRVQAPFLVRNRRLLDELRELGARGRRADLLPSDATQARFYLDRLPDQVCSVATFNRFVETAGGGELARLTMTPADLAGDAGTTVEERDFPTRLRVGDLDIPLAYKFAPGEPDDGVSVRIPPGWLSRLDAAWLDWLVPGFLEEKCLALGRALPKSLRRRLAPLRQCMGVVHERLREPATYRSGNLADALTATVRACHGVDVPVHAWRLGNLPCHLRMNVQVRDARKRIVDQDRDLCALRGRLQSQVVRTLTDEVRRSLERRDIHIFPSRGVPDSITVGDAANGHVAYPVLVDRGDSVDLLVRSTPERRAALNRDGYTRLALLAEPRLACELRRQAERDGTLMRHYAALGSAAGFAVDLVAAAFWFACFDGDTLPVAKNGFDERLAAGKGVLQETFVEILGHARRTLISRTEVAGRLETLASPAYATSRTDLVAQLENLVPPNFLRITPRCRLPDLPRYLDGMAYRIENLQGRIERDISGIDAIAVWERRLTTLAEQCGAPSNDDIAALRFLVEEFRIATFAQRLGTREKVSEKRLARRFEAVAASVGKP